MRDQSPFWFFCKLFRFMFHSPPHWFGSLINASSWRQVKIDIRRMCIIFPSVTTYYFTMVTTLCNKISYLFVLYIYICINILVICVATNSIFKYCMFCSRPLIFQFLYLLNCLSLVGCVIWLLGERHFLGNKTSTFYLYKCRSSIQI